MGFISSVMMIEALRAHLKPLTTADPPLLAFEPEVVEWYNPDNMIKDTLQNEQCMMVVSVKRGDSLTHRVYNGVPCSDNTMWEIDIWMIDAPHYRKDQSTPPREIVLEKVKEFFQLHSSFGTIRACQNKDHSKKQLWILQTKILATQLNEELTTQP
jgi:hypothetical protein